jgi:hypothetical protein
MPTWKNCVGVTHRESLQLGPSALLQGGLVSGFRARGYTADVINTPHAKSTASILVWSDRGRPTRRFSTLNQTPPPGFETVGEMHRGHPNP